MSAPTITERPVRVDFTDRSQRRRRRLRMLLATVGLLLVAGAVWAVFFSSLLAASSVRVVGVDGVAADQVAATAAVPLGVPLARIDTAQSQAAVVALPWVESVEVRRGWPDEVVIAVVARQPIAVLAKSGTAVDASGVAFEPLGTLPASLPTVTASGVGIQTAMGVLASPPPDLAGRVVSLAGTTRDDVTMTLRSGALVRWGSVDQAEFKAEVLRALLRQKRLVYDVSAPELATTFRVR